jgi:hypothetical protein
MDKEISEDIKRITDVLTGNRVETLDDYRYLTGQLRGLTVALNKLKSLQKQVENDENWED